MLWTKLENSLLANAAKPLYTDPRRAYHDLAHIERMFAWAAHFNLPYCEDLDKAVWGHDVILDPHGQNEVRSRDWLLAVDPTAKRAGQLVMTTIMHSATDDNRLIMLDLADFIDENQAKANTAALEVESMRMGATSIDAVHKGMRGYLGHLNGRLSADIAIDAFGADTNTFKAIRLGVEKTISRLS